MVVVVGEAEFRRGILGVDGSGGVGIARGSSGGSGVGVVRGG